MDGYLLCDTKYAFDQALAALRSSPRIILDCEGMDLGKEGGKLSLISLRTTSPRSQTFLIDVLQLEDRTLRPLFDILESSAYIKIVFDGRMDFSELYHSRNVSIAGVLDLQLVDISSRRLRGEGEDRQLQRLSPYLNHGEVASQRVCYTQIHKLGGLTGCLNEHNVRFYKNSSVSHSQWLHRPLSALQLRYAAEDVYAIGALLDHFKTKNYIEEEILFKQSQRYISLWIDGRPRSQDGFKSHALLPLDILDHSNPDSAITNATQGMFSCEFCKRRLPSRCFPNAAPRNSLANHQCWVCRALNVKTHIEAQSSRVLWEDVDGYGWGDDGLDDFNMFSLDEFDDEDEWEAYYDDFGNDWN